MHLPVVTVSGWDLSGLLRRIHDTSNFPFPLYTEFQCEHQNIVDMILRWVTQRTICAVQFPVACALLQPYFLLLLLVLSYAPPYVVDNERWENKKTGHEGPVFVFDE